MRDRRPATDAYFAELTRVLRAAGRGQPEVVVDLERVDRNLDRVSALLGRRALRIAVKSLPCPRLVRHLLRRSGSNRLMAFDAGMLRQCVAEFPDADVLLGKPLPAAAVRWFHTSVPPAALPSAAAVCWLVDTPARVRQYAGIASGLGLTLRVCVELDVGLHRGGVADQAQLAAVLDAIAASGGRLRLAGFMGYDAHAAKAPWPRTSATAMAQVRRRYEEFLRAAREGWPALLPGELVLNGAGSPTLPLLEAGSPLNEVALGSVLVKPSDFDLPGLEAMEPAAWIATPVLKDLRGMRLPYLESLAGLIGRGRRTLFVYGGRWMARPAWPPGMRGSPLYGESSNQQFMSVPVDATVGVDDYVYFRPTQSEAVLDQFGALTVVAAGCAEHWPAFDRDAEPHGE
jgi:D-serine deaminase-like pyridoxal phosphate-dependent protein